MSSNVLFQQQLNPKDFLFLNLNPHIREAAFCDVLTITIAAHQVSANELINQYL